MVVKIDIIKMGNIGTSPVIDLILDERADREDIDVRTLGTGSKMGKKQLDDILPKINELDSDLIIFISPNPNAKEPKRARETLSELNIPTIIIGDRPGEKAIDQMKEQGLGYILIRADPMIGARREFLDPTEMALFNSDVLKVLSITGVFRLLHKKIDQVIESILNNKSVELPEIVMTAEMAVKEANFKNPYAKSKAIAAYNIASEVSKIDTKACFKVKNSEEYILLVSSAHEMISTAANLATEAREIEKANDSIYRTAHRRDGKLVHKTSLMGD